MPAPNPGVYLHNPTVWADPLGLMPDACKVTVSPMDSDWATKGAHVHIDGKEVRVFPDGSGGIGVDPIRMSHGVPTDAQMQRVQDLLASDPKLRADMIAKARAAMTEMNADNWGNSLNRAIEMNS